MERYPALLIEAFSPRPLQGNGAAVVLLEHPATVGWMQGLANSLRQSETAFLWRQPDGPWALRWFTPSTEVPLCGHATLAATLGLHHWQLLQPGASLRLATRSGALAVSVSAGPEPLVGLTLPGGGLMPEPQVPAYLQGLLGANPLAYWSSGLGYRVLWMPPTFPLADLHLETSELQGPDRQGLVLMQEATAETPPLGNHPCDYQLRFFAPGLGIDEDPVTGSAHALVAPWWMERLQRPAVRGWQASQRRGGMLCEADTPGFVRLSGTGHLLWDGQIHAPGCGHDAMGWRVCSSG
jgi:predicted PhzF superfamily epimerase YddE/YHI9